MKLEDVLEVNLKEYGEYPGCDCFCMCCNNFSCVRTRRNHQNHACLRCVATWSIQTYFRKHDS